jgi:hypothetical protein
LALADDRRGVGGCLLQALVESEAAAIASGRERAFEEQGELVQSDGLLDVVVGPDLHGANGGFDGSESGHHNNRAIEAIGAQALDEVDPVLGPEVDIGEDGLEGLAFEQLVGLGA